MGPSIHSTKPAGRADWAGCDCEVAGGATSIVAMTMAASNAAAPGLRQKRNCCWRPITMPSQVTRLAVLKRAADRSKDS
jgi:hypothetical protein